MQILYTYSNEYILREKPTANGLAMMFNQIIILENCLTKVSHFSQLALLMSFNIPARSKADKFLLKFNYNHL